MYFYSVILHIAFCTRSDALNDSVSSNNINDINEVILSTNKEPITSTTIINSSDDGESDISIEYNKTVTWDTYFDELTTTTIEQLDTIRHNIIENYNLDDLQIESVNNLFNDSSEYEIILHKNLKKIVRSNNFNNTDEFKLSFTNMSNQLLVNLIKYNLDKIEMILRVPSKWYKQTLKDKIQRQETKIATNHINYHICRTLNVCKENENYTDYLREWLRQLLSTPSVLKDLFTAVPVLLEKHKRFISFNVKFRQTIKYISNSNAVVQKDTLDFVDEILTNKQNVVKLAPAALRNSTRYLKKLFKVIDQNFVINENNVIQLDRISTMFHDWTQEGKATITIETILDSIVENMKLNFKTWSVKAQNEVDNIWLDIIALE